MRTTVLMRPSVTEQCHGIAELLRSLSPGVSTQDQIKIAHALDAVDQELCEYRDTTTSMADSDMHCSQESGDLSSVSHHELLDTESLDFLDEDLHKDDSTRATGFVGKASDVQWLRAVTLAQTERENEDMGGTIPHRRGSYIPGGDQMTSFSYWADGKNVDIDFFVDPYELPQMETAERLLQCYMLKVHGSFPILPRRIFEDQFRRYFTALHNGNAPRLSHKWQAILNMVFAIGAKFSHLTETSWRADERDHLIYQARARAFGLNEGIITTHSDLPQIQSLGLLSFYWLSVGQVSRAWTVVGIALRFAYSLGLHVRNEDPSATAAKRETLVRTWWSLYSLERTLSIVTGRPSTIADSCCSVPLPIPLPEENFSENVEATSRTRKGSTTTLLSPKPLYSSFSSATIDTPQAPGGFVTATANSGSHFKATIQLSIITHDILRSLYSTGTMIRSPGEFQQVTTQLNQRLDEWIGSLPVQFNFQAANNESGDEFDRERVLLEFQLCSAKILLTRPCLSGWRQPWKDAREASFAKRMANSCIDAAKTIVSFLPEGPRSNFVYNQGPWWCIVHHTMQAISVFLLGLSCPSSSSHNSQALVENVKKAIRWLQTIQDPVAERAYHVALETFESVARRCSVDVSAFWGVDTEEMDAVRRRGVHSGMSHASVTPYLADHFDTIAPTSVAHPALATPVVYDAVMSDAGFHPPHETSSYDEIYYMAR
ncbi:Nn.00g092000.m01.CDS01 [Neocucurbitaria sp. VM-36]